MEASLLAAIYELGIVVAFAYTSNSWVPYTCRFPRVLVRIRSANYIAVPHT